MSIHAILVILGCAMAYLLIEELFDAIWNALVVRRRKAEEEAKLQRIEKIIADARLTGTPIVVEDRRGANDVPSANGVSRYASGD